MESAARVANTEPRIGFRTVSKQPTGRIPLSRADRWILGWKPNDARDRWSSLKRHWPLAEGIAGFTPEPSIGTVRMASELGRSGCGS